MAPCRTAGVYAMIIRISEWGRKIGVPNAPIKAECYGRFITVPLNKPVIIPRELVELLQTAWVAWETEGGYAFEITE